METGPVRADADWLSLREPADAAARSRRLVDLLPPGDGTGRRLVHDLGGGSGSMARWLAPLLPGAQHWIVHDRDGELLPTVHRLPPGPARDGAPVTVETRQDDITRLPAAELSGASLVTASALLDMLTLAELRRLVDLATSPRCPVLLALSVTGTVALDPTDPLDRLVARAFDDHQRRPAEEGPRLGPDAWRVAAEELTARGLRVLVEPTPWQLGPAEAGLAAAWFDGWFGPACEQDPSLAARGADYARRRRRQAADGRLRVTVDHRDLLALPSPD